MPVWIQRAQSIIVTIGKTFKTHWSIYFSFQLPKRFLCIDLVKWRFHFRFKNATEVSTILSEICDLSLDKNVRQRRRLCRRLSHNKNNNEITFTASNDVKISTGRSTTINIHIRWSAYEIPKGYQPSYFLSSWILE